MALCRHATLSVLCMDIRHKKAKRGWCRGSFWNASNEFKKIRDFRAKWRPCVARPIWQSRRAWLAVETLIKSGSVFEGAVRGAASWWQHGLCARAKSEVYLNTDLAVTVFLQSSVSRAFPGSSLGSPQSRWHPGRQKVFFSKPQNENYDLVHPLWWCGHIHKYLFSLTLAQTRHLVLGSPCVRILFWIWNYEIDKKVVFMFCKLTTHLKIKHPIFSLKIMRDLY